MAMDQYAQPNRTTPLQSVCGQWHWVLWWLSVSDLFSYLFTVKNMCEINFWSFTQPSCIAAENSFAKPNTDCGMLRGKVKQPHDINLNSSYLSYRYTFGCSFSSGLVGKIPSIWYLAAKQWQKSLLVYKNDSENMFVYDMNSLTKMALWQCAQGGHWHWRRHSGWRSGTCKEIRCSYIESLSKHSLNGMVLC